MPSEELSVKHNLHVTPVIRHLLALVTLITPLSIVFIVHVIPL